MVIDFTINIASVAKKSYVGKQSTANFSSVILLVVETWTFCVILSIFALLDPCTWRISFFVHQEFAGFERLTPYT